MPFGPAAKIPIDTTGNQLGTSGNPFITSLVDQTIFNVKYAPYNAKGDGVTDDTAAIQAALNAAAANSPNVGGVVFLPPGTYKTSASLVFNADQIILRGSGWNTIIQPASGATFDVISTPIPASAGLSGFTRQYIGIESINIDCTNMTGNVAGQGNGIHWYGVKYSHIYDVYIHSCPNWAILLDGDNTNPGKNFGFDNVVYKCVFDLCAANVYQTNCEANDFVECRFKWCGAATTALQPANGSQDTTALHLRLGSGYAYVDGNIFGKGGTYTTEAIRCSNNGPCRIINNRFDQVRQQAVILNGGNHVFCNNALGSPSSNQVLPGIQIGSSNNIVAYNHFDNTAGAIHYSYAIAEAGGPFSNNEIIGNNLLVGSSGFINLNATSTDLVKNNTGYNPVGSITPPAFPNTTVAVQNTKGVDVTAYIANGTGAITQIQIAGAGGTLVTTGLQIAANGWGTVRIPAGGQINFTYASGTPTWTWFGD